MNSYILAIIIICLTVYVDASSNTCIVPSSKGVKICIYSCTDCKDKTSANNALQQISIIDPKTPLSNNVSYALTTIKSTLQYVVNTPYTQYSKTCFLTYGTCLGQCNNCLDKTMCIQVNIPVSTIINSPNVPYDVMTVATNLKTACGFISGSFINSPNMLLLFALILYAIFFC